LLSLWVWPKVITLSGFYCTNELIIINIETWCVLDPALSHLFGLFKRSKKRYGTNNHVIWCQLKEPRTLASMNIIKNKQYLMHITESVRWLLHLLKIRSNKWRPRVNFINVLRAAFAPVDPKSVKRYWQLDWILTLLGATGVKAVRKYVGEIDPQSQFHKRSTSSFCARRSQKCKKGWQLNCLFGTIGIRGHKSCL